MLSEKEKKAIEYLTKYIHWETAGERSLETDIETVLNLITKLQKENEILKRAFDKQTADMSNNLLELQQKDKQIDLMAEMIDELSEYYTRYNGKNNEFCKEVCIKKDIDCIDCIKQYFEIKAKKGE